MSEDCHDSNNVPTVATEEELAEERALLSDEDRAKLDALPQPTE